MISFRAGLQHGAEQRLDPGAVGRVEPHPFTFAADPRGKRARRPNASQPFSATSRRAHLFQKGTL